MTARIRIVVGAMLAVALAGWLLVLPHDPAPRELARSPELAAASTYARLGSDGGDGATALRSEAVGQRDLAAVVDEIRTRLVVVLPDDRRAPDAVVRYWPARSEAQQAADEKVADSTRDFETALRATGRAATTDARGEVEIDVERHSRVCARLGDLYGELDLPDGEPPPCGLRLVLGQDVTWCVHLIDTDGRACADVGVQLEVRAVSRRHGIQDDGLFVETGPDGRGTLVHVQRHVAMPGDDVVDWQLTIVCGSDKMPLVTRTLRWEDLVPGEPIRLIAPIGGTVVPHVVDADGRRPRATTFLHDPERFASWHVGSADDEGRFVYRNVPLGRRWHLRASVNKTPVHREFLGPVHRDDVVHVDLELPERTWEVHGRLVRADGVVLAGAAVTWRARTGPAFTFDVHGGEFHQVLTTDPSTRTIDDLVFDVTHPLYDGPVSVPVAKSLASGPTQLGDVVVPNPVGEVSLAHVEIRLEGRSVTAAGWARVYDATPGKRREELHTRSRPDGTACVLLGRAPIGPLELQCGHAGCRYPTMRIQVGEHVVVDLQRMAMLQLVVRAPAVPESLLEAELLALDERADRENGDRVVSSDDLGAHDAFELEAAPGRYALRVRLGERVLWQLPSIELAPGNNMWPSDGSALDLRDRARAVFLDVRPADGVGEVTIDATFAAPRDVAEPPGNLSPFLVQHGPWFVPGREPRDVLLHANGFVPVRVPNPTTDVVVLLQRLTTVLIPALDDPSARFDVRLVEDVVRDAWLRAIDDEDAHQPVRTWSGTDETQLAFAPGTVLEVVVQRPSGASAPQRVVVGTTSPQHVALR